MRFSVATRRIDRNQRGCARFAIVHGPGERLRGGESAESGKTYPGAILPGSWIIALDSHQRCGTRSETYSYLAGGLAEQSLDHLDVAGHPDMCVSLQSFTEQRLRFVAIT